MTATIIQKPTAQNSYYWVVQEDLTDQVHYLRGPGAPKDGEIGDVGFLSYQSGPNYGFLVWRVA